MMPTLQRDPTVGRIAPGCGQACLACLRLSRHAGACGGMATAIVPACHMDLDGRLEWPLQDDGRGGMELVPGQERFYRFAQVATNVYAAIRRTVAGTRDQGPGTGGSGQEAA